MLSILSGVSGAGKSTVMEILERQYGWKIVSTYMTRKQRENEFHKTYLPESDFNMKKNEGYFLCVNEVYGAQYGTPFHEIKNACSATDELWIIDFPIQKTESTFINFSYSFLCCSQKASKN